MVGILSNPSRGDRHPDAGKDPVHDRQFPLSEPQRVSKQPSLLLIDKIPVPKIPRHPDPEQMRRFRRGQADKLDQGLREVHERLTIRQFVLVVVE